MEKNTLRQALKLLIIVSFPTLLFHRLLYVKTIELYADRSSFPSSNLNNHAIRSSQEHDDTNMSSVRYLWCANHYGPNNQIKDFIKCSVIAMMNNFTLVLPPLYPNYNDKVRTVQDFGHFYDLEPLAAVIKFIPLHRFLIMESSSLRNVLNCYLQQEKLSSYMMRLGKKPLNTIWDLYRIKVNFHEYRYLSSIFDMGELRRNIGNCTLVYLNVDYLALNELSAAKNKNAQKIFPHLKRTPLIQRMASQLIDGFPQLTNERIQGAQLSTLAVAHIRLGDRVVMAVPRYIEQMLDLIKRNVSFTHLHIMCLFLTATDISQFTNTIPIPITTTKTLFDQNRFAIDEYLFDVLEQEIAFQAPIFIASPWTTYSATVVFQKLFQDNGTVYIFSDTGPSRASLVSRVNFIYYN